MKGVYNRYLKEIVNGDLYMKIFCASVFLYLLVAIPILMGGL